MSRAPNITKPHWRCRCGCVVFPLNDETSCDCADVYEQDWTLIEPTMPAGDELTRLRAENALIRAALKPILARIEMPAGGFSRTQDVMIQASELVALQTALAGEDSNG